jgi:hypothetical protein
VGIIAIVENGDENVSQENDKDRSEKFWEMFKMTNKENPRNEDVSALRKMINTDPEFYASLVPLAKSTAESLFTKVTNIPGMQETLRANMLAIREELGYSTSPQFERTLIDHVALCWLRLQFAEQWYSEIALKGTHTIESGLYYEKRLAAAQKRYLRAIETLAKIRKISVSITVLNLAAPGGQQKVNQLFQNN